jgi:hypothetical protein
MTRRRRTTPARLRANRRIARRHGLAIPVLAEPGLAPEVHHVARMIERSVAGAELGPQAHALACRVAEAMIDLRRVRILKLPLTAALHADPAKGRAPLAELARLDRYERRALSRRNTAAREFAEAVGDARRVGKGGHDLSSDALRQSAVPTRVTAPRSRGHGGTADVPHAASASAAFAHPTAATTRDLAEPKRNPQ